MNHYKGGGRGGLHEHIKQLKNGIFIKEGCPDYSVHLLPQMYQIIKSLVIEPCDTPWNLIILAILRFVFAIADITFVNYHFKKKSTWF